MGQRLNIEIVDNSGVLANAYYHWSAYTGSAIELTLVALAAFDTYKGAITDPREMAIAMLEETGAGVNDEELRRIESSEELRRYDIRRCQNRNTGLLAISPEGISETEYWEEGRVTIDIQSKRVVFSVYCGFYSYEEWLEYHWGDVDSDTGKKVYRSLPIYDVSPYDISFDEFYRLQEIYNETEENGYRVKSDGEIITWIR